MIRIGQASTKRFAPSRAAAGSKRLVSNASTSTQRTRPLTRNQRILCIATAAAGTAWALSRGDIQNDAVLPSNPSSSSAKSQASNGVPPSNDGPLVTLVWGSNKNHLLSSEEGLSESVRTPAISNWLQGVALRDLVLHDKHAACIDARGDVYQWGDAFSGSTSSVQPKITLRGKDIISLQCNADRVFALSSSGKIFVLSASQPQQQLPESTQAASGSPWWGTGWIWAEEKNVDSVELTANEKLNWREKFTSIAAGNDHLLALTSNGRTFAHPINPNANAYGQLGFRKFDVPARSQSSNVPDIQNARVDVELIPKSTSDPFSRATRQSRPSSDNSATSFSLVGGSIHFSDKLFEVPALKEVQVEKIAAGGRSSFVKTPNGRVLGWGANEFGQIGLGSNVTLEAITVPSEVVLWRSTPPTMRTRCLDIYAGGDLTVFKVERADGTAIPYIDVLACGNGQYGGLGNAQFTNSQGAPVRAKNVSGLLEYSEKTNSLQPIDAHNISISPTGHVLLTLDTLTRAGPGAGGRDLLGWGANQEFQLGNGKRGSVASPFTLYYNSSDDQRILLAKRSADVKDLNGQLWRKGVQVEQRAVAGWGNSVVYWRICT